MGGRFRIPSDVPIEHRNNVAKCLGMMQTHIENSAGSHQWTFDDFELGHSLGRGQFGQVYLARERKSHYLVALKTMSKKHLMSERHEKQVLREIEIHSHLSHPHILCLLTFFHDKRNIFLVLEYAAEGEVFAFMKKQPGGRFDNHLAAKYTYQVADALEFCHKNNVIHRDIKPENLLLDSNGNIKLADFGWSVHAPSSKRYTMCGTLDYIPPEMIQHQSYSIYVDHWCLGILCYEFLAGKPPFTSGSREKTFSKIKTANIPWPRGITPGAKDLISKLIRKTGRERLPLSDVKKHFWILEHKDGL